MSPPGHTAILWKHANTRPLIFSPMDAVYRVDHKAPGLTTRAGGIMIIVTTKVTTKGVLIGQTAFHRA